MDPEVGSLPEGLGLPVPKPLLCPVPPVLVLPVPFDPPLAPDWSVPLGVVLPVGLPVPGSPLPSGLGDGWLPSDGLGTVPVEEGSLGVPAVPGSTDAGSLPDGVLTGSAGELGAPGTAGSDEDGAVPAGPPVSAPVATSTADPLAGPVRPIGLPGRPPVPTRAAPSALGPPVSADAAPLSGPD